MRVRAGLRQCRVQLLADYGAASNAATLVSSALRPTYRRALRLIANLVNERASGRA